MMSKQRKTEILELYESMSATEKTQFDNIRAVRRAKMKHLNEQIIILTLIAFISVPLALVAVSSYKAPLVIVLIPLLMMLFVEIWGFRAANIVNLDAQKSWVSALNMPKYYDIVKIIWGIEDTEIKKRGEP